MSDIEPKKIVKYFDNNCKIGDTVVLEIPPKYGDPCKLVIEHLAESLAKSMHEDIIKEDV